MEERKTEGHIMRIAKLSVALFVLGSAIVGAEESQLAKPTPVQYAWHEQERIMFVCLDPATWQGGEYDNHTTKLSDMKLGKLDVDQWMAVAESWGAKEILLVCKHTGGFCWWPTETTDYSVKNIAWKDGKGNLVKEVADACRRHGLKMGVYIYPDDPRYSKGAGGGGRTGDPNKQEEWNRLLRKQWEEVLTMCGTDLVNEIWFDGNCIVPLTDILQRLAPNAVVLQSPVASIRWVGNENGLAQDPNWNTVSGDTIMLVDKGTESFTASKVTLSATAVFQDYANAVVNAGGDGSTNGRLGWFQFSGDTYVVESLHNAGTTADFINNTDLVVKLTGLVDLSTASLASGSGPTLLIA